MKYITAQLVPSYLNWFTLSCAVFLEQMNIHLGLKCELNLDTWISKEFV